MNIYHPPNLDINKTKYKYKNTKCKNLCPADKCFSGWGGERDQTSEVGFEIHIILKIILRNILRFPFKKKSYYVIF